MDPEEKQCDCRCRREEHGGEDAFFHTFERAFLLHEDDPVGPGKKVEHDHICRDKEYAAAPKDTVHQRDPDKTAVGVHAVEPLDTAARSGRRTDQECGDEDPQYVGSKSCRECQQQPSYHVGVIFRVLVDRDDEQRVDDHEQQIGYGTVSVLIHKFYFVTDKCEQHNEEHLQKLLEDQYKHGKRNLSTP